MRVNVRAYVIFFFRGKYLVRNDYAWQSTILDIGALNKNERKKKNEKLGEKNFNVSKYI